jgi:hypothetical protein
MRHPFRLQWLGVVHQRRKNNSPKPLMPMEETTSNQPTMFLLSFSIQPQLLLLPIAVSFYQSLIVLIPSIRIEGFVFPRNELYGHIRRKADLGR